MTLDHCLDQWKLRLRNEWRKLEAIELNGTTVSSPDYVRTKARISIMELMIEEVEAATAGDDV